MIQVADLLKKDYHEIKDFVVWKEEDKMELDLLEKNGLIPQLKNAKYSDDIYLYDTHLTKNDVRFMNNKVFEIYFGAHFNMGCLILFKLLYTQEFGMKFFTRKYVDDFHEDYISKYDREPDLKTIKESFDETWSFDVHDMKIYDFINLYNSKMNIDIYFSDTIKNTIMLEFFINNPDYDANNMDTGFLSLQN